MSYFTTTDGTQIYYKDWGTGQPVVFSHGWPLSSDAFEDQMLFLSQQGYRCIGYDRRGFGRSDQPGQGNDYDTYADDLAALLEKLDLREAVLVGHSMGGGDVARYLGRHGSARVSKAVLIAAVCPMMLKTADNPEGLPMEAFDGMREKVMADRSQFFQDLPLKFYGFNLLGAKASDGVRDAFWLQAMEASLAATYACIRNFSETDFTADLQAIDVPTLILHGDDDQIVPMAPTSERTAQLVRGSTLKVYPGFSHGLCTINKDEVNADLLAFLQAGAPAIEKRDDRAA